jgi:YidC/Oxa1 family membrane protein insertase
LAEFKNPQQEPGMDKRLLLIFALTFFIVIAFQPLLKKYLPQPPVTPQQNQPQPQPQSQSSPEPAAISPATPTAPAADTQVASAETETVIDSDLYHIVFSNRGAQVKSWILKKYDDESGHPLDLVNNPASAKYGYPLSLWTYDETQRNHLNTALYVASSTGALAAPASLTFDYAEQGWSVHKTFSFDATYALHCETSVTLNGAPVTAFPAWPAGFGDQFTGPAFAAERIETQFNSSIERTVYKKVSGGATLHGPFDWAALANQYFAIVFIPDNVQDVSLVTLRNPLDIPKDPSKPNGETQRVDVLGAAFGNPHGTTDQRIFVGPKDLKILESTSIPTIAGADTDLRGLVDFGWWGIIARPLFVWLKWLHGYVHNWGWAIVIQTFMITLALLPLRISSMRSALRMQKIQPQMNAIKEKYKKYSIRDARRQEMNTEIGELMKKEGVNPVGGCLPIIIQMPFLIAYYRMLGGAIELRHAHWLWISDLSAKDPWLILPLLMVGSMFLTQRMTPQTGMDPAQQRMMNVMMPLMMGFLFFNFAAGLNLYYAESNLIMIVQQAIMNRTGLGREMRELAEKRARKKDKK